MDLGGSKFAATGGSKLPATLHGKDENIEKQPSDDTSDPILGYDGRCRKLSATEIQDKLGKSLPYVIRQKINKEGQTTFNDFVYGEITIDHKQLEDQILLKSDGYPTYNFANVVDDHLMGITHVMRGCEYISSTPKYILLYRAFGWGIPEHIHLPHILNENSRKLSKREGSVALSDFLRKGYLPEAILNYIALLGWNPGTEEEFFSKEGLIEKFDIARIGKASSIFDEKKLLWLNSQHIKAKKVEEIHESFLKFYPDRIVNGFDIKKITALIHGRVEKMSDIPQMVSFLMELDEKYSPELFINKKNKTTIEWSLAVLKDLESILSVVVTWDYNGIYGAVNSYAESKGSKIGAIMWPLRIAISGLAVTPGGAIEIAELLGKPESIRRILLAIRKL